jgi:hypothetical protein
MLQRRSFLILTLLFVLSACSEPEETKIQIAGQTALSRPDRSIVDETGILIRVVGATAKALTDVRGNYDAGTVSSTDLVIEHSKEGYGRKLFPVSDYAPGPLSLVWLFPITPNLAITGEPRYFDSAFVQHERVGVKLNDRGDTIDQGTVVEKFTSQELLAIPVTVEMLPGAAMTKYMAVDLYYSDQPIIDIMDPRTYLWMETARFDTPQEIGNTTTFYQASDMLDWVKKDLRPAGTKLYVRAFASPYYRATGGINAPQNHPFFIDPVTRKSVFSIYEGVQSNATSFILR